MGVERRIVSPRFIGREADAAVRLALPADEMITAGPGPGDETDSVAPIHGALADAVTASVKDGKRPVCIVGDCCQSIGVMAGLVHAGLKPALVWLDSHGDFNTWETTPSGFLGGMPLAMLTGRGDQRMMEAVDLAPLTDDRILLSDGRDLDPGERALVKESGIRHMEKVIGVPYVLPEGLIHLHIDTDILDARLAPAFLYPVKGGPSPQGLAAVIESILETGKVAALSICAAWDTLHHQGQATEAAVKRALEPIWRN